MVSSTASTHIEHAEREAARDRLATETPAAGIVLGSDADRPVMARTCNGLTGHDTSAYREGAK
jgi:hypothetical protein